MAETFFLKNHDKLEKNNIVVSCDDDDEDRTEVEEKNVVQCRPKMSEIE